MSELAGEVELFFPTADGTLKITETKLSVEPALIYIEGAVECGFSVRAEGDILIEGGSRKAPRLAPTRGAS